MRMNESAVELGTQESPDAEVRLTMAKSREGSRASVRVAPPAASDHVPAPASCAIAASPCCATIVAASSVRLPARETKNRMAHTGRIDRRVMQVARSRTARVGPAARQKVTYAYGRS